MIVLPPCWILKRCELKNLNLTKMFLELHNKKNRIFNKSKGEFGWLFAITFFKNIIRLSRGLERDRKL